jgi:hypothetical protein
MSEEETAHGYITLTANYSFHRLFLFYSLLSFSVDVWKTEWLY